MAALDPAEAGVAAAAKGILGWHATHRFCARCGAPSEPCRRRLEAALPGLRRTALPAHRPGGDHAGDPWQPGAARPAAGWPPAMYSLLAGFMEPGESIEAAVRRETFEEAGVAVGAVRYLSSQPWPFPSSLMIGCAGEALGDTLRLDPVEIEAARWVSREDAVEALAGRDPSMMPARRGSIARFLIERWLADGPCSCLSEPIN
jgi:NAD+ diphosphatase